MELEQGVLFFTLLGSGPSHTLLPQPRGAKGFFLHSIWFVLFPLKACFADASNVGFFVQKSQLEMFQLLAE